MSRSVAYFIVVSLLILQTDFAVAETAVFGPEKYVRGRGEPQKVTKSFSVNNPTGEFKLVVQNGEGKRGRVSSALVQLNGVNLVGPNVFNKKVDAITLPVTLRTQNDLTVEVRSQPGTSLIVTVLGAEDPPHSPLGAVRAYPDGFPVNTPTQVTFTAAIPYLPGGPIPTVEIDQVSQDGQVLAIEGVMVDNGQLSLGDEIQGDRVFSFRKTYSIPQPSTIKLQIKATVGGQSFYSDIFPLTAFIPISESEVNAMNNAERNAVQLYYQLLKTNGKGTDKALAAVVAFLKADPFVQDAVIGTGGTAIGITYINGMHGVLALNPPGTRGGPPLSALTQQSPSLSANVVQTASQPGNIAVQSKKVLILSPFLDEFGATDEGLPLKAMYENHNNTSNCPHYDIKYVPSVNVDVDIFKTLHEYGIVHIASHGTVDPVNNQVIILTKVLSEFANMAFYQADIDNGRLVRASVTSGEYLAVTPAFFTYYLANMPSSLVYASACNSTSNNSMSNALLGKGAAAYLGFSDVVPSNYAYDKATFFHKNWIDDPTTLVTAGEVWNAGGFVNCTVGPNLHIVCWNLLPTTSSNLEAPAGGLADGSFESGALGAWTPQGDGRVETFLGQFSPTDGTYMGLVSTGLGHTVDSGSISQQACIPANATTLSFDWNFNSEEFREYCGSIYQDFFKVDLIAENGATTNLLYQNVDSLCAGTFHVTNSFDQGDVWSTGWKSSAIDISAFATANVGKSATIRFSAGDVGDSIFDTAILLDKIKVNAP